MHKINSHTVSCVNTLQENFKFQIKCLMILNAFYVRNIFTRNMMVHMSDNHELFEELIATIENQDY